MSESLGRAYPPTEREMEESEGIFSLETDRKTADFRILTRSCIKVGWEEEGRRGEKEGKEETQTSV